MELTKTKLRKKVISKRDNLYENNIKYCLQASDVIANLFLNKFSMYNSYGLYCNIMSEVITDGLFNGLAKKKIFIPKVSGSEILFGKYESLKLVKGFMGVPEPEIISAEIPDIVVVPGVAFDKSGFRIGYGKGFYDRFFKKNCNILKVGIAYQLQIVDNVMPENHDISMDYIITESNLYCFC